MHLDTREGLEEKITLQWRHFTKIQILDYEGVPFRCRRRHKVGHLFKECPLVCKATNPPIGTEGTAEKTTIPIPGSTPLAVVTTIGMEPPTNQAASSGPRPPSPMMTRSRVAAEAARSSGTPPSLISTFYSSPAFSASATDGTLSSIPCRLIPQLPVFSTTPQPSSRPRLHPISPL